MTLAKLKAGRVAIIVAVRPGSPVFSDRYAARGIVPGAEVFVVGHGDPIAVALDDSRWAISRAEAEHIEVAVI